MRTGSAQVLLIAAVVLWYGIPGQRITQIARAQPQVSALARVTAVEVSGEAGAYRFSITIESPDTGCDRYANWWEVLTAEGELLYRRILAHSHVTEQPFTRSGGPVRIEAAQTVIVRAHMDPQGYGQQALQGSVAEGFTAVELSPNFAAALAQQDPLPSGCAF